MIVVSSFGVLLTCWRRWQSWKCPKCGTFRYENNMPPGNIASIREADDLTCRHPQWQAYYYIQPEPLIPALVQVKDVGKKVSREVLSMAST